MAVSEPALYKGFSSHTQAIQIFSSDDRERMAIGAQMSDVAKVIVVHGMILLML